MKKIRKIVLSERGVYEPKITEDMIVKEIMVRLGYAGIKVWRIVERIPWGRTTSTPGIPDLIGYRKNSLGQHIPVFLEIKKPGGKHRPAQERFIAEVKADGCIAGFCESWEDVVKLFKENGVH